MRKGIEPVLATVILISVCMILAVGIAGFVFHQFGTFTAQGPTTTTTSQPVPTTGPLEWNCTQLHDRINYYLNNPFYYYAGNSAYAPNPTTGYLLQIYQAKGCFA